MSITEQLFRFLAPYDCINCGQEGRLLCRWCANDKLLPTTESCYRCNRLSPGFKTCSTCRHHSVLKHVWVRTDYNETAKELVHQLKFAYAKDAAKLIAEELTTTLPYINPDTLIAYVPAATAHMRQRGFDQSALIARELAKRLKLRHLPTLARLGQQHQVGSGRQTRQEQMKNVFRPISLPVVKDAHLLLVDDVLTTGATMEAAARTLREAGAKTVNGVVFAQVK